MTTHRERMERCIAGEQPDRVPVAFWRHFPVDDQTAEGQAAAHLWFQRSFDFDLVKVTPDPRSACADGAPTTSGAARARAPVPIRTA